MWPIRVREMARERLLNEMGKESSRTKDKNTPAHIYAGNGNFVGDGISLRWPVPDLKMSRRIMSITG
ncbi:hypothetical protein ACLB1Q_08420 [Escherichia coli]